MRMHVAMHVCIFMHVCMFNAVAGYFEMAKLLPSVEGLYSHNYAK